MKGDKFYPLMRILYQFREYYPIIIIYSICISILTLATPISVQALVSTFSFGPFFQPIFILAVLLLGILTVMVSITIMQYLMVEYLQRRLYAKLTAVIGRAYFLEKLSNKNDLRGRANRYFDIVSLQKNVIFLITDSVAMVLQTFLGLILISFYHPYFIVLSFTVLICTVFPLILFGKKALSSSVEESSAKYQVAGYLEDLDMGVKKESVQEGDFAQFKISLDKQIAGFLEKRIKHFRTVFAQKTLYLVMYAVLNALLLGMGGFLVASHQLTIGQLVAAEIVVNAVLGQYLYAHKHLESFYDSYAVSWKLAPFFIFIDEHKAQSKAEEKGKSTLYARRTRDFCENMESVRSVYSPKNHRKTARNFIISALLVLILLLITPWQQTSRGYGRVTAYDPNDRVQNITATVTGLVESWLVQDGQMVKKGDPIVQIIDNDPNFLIRLEGKRDAAIKKFEAAKTASDTARLNFHRQEQLVKEGLSSSKEFEQAKISYKKLQAEEAAAAVELANSEVDLSRQQLQRVTAPRDGQIRRILVGSGTINVKAGDPLVEFVPSTSENIVELFIEGMDLPLIYPGRKVRLQFEGWPSVQFSGFPSVAIGSFGGVVTVVDPSVSADGLFRVLVKPDPDDAVSWPDQTYLRQGARTNGLVVLDQVSVGYEMWRQINGFPKSMPVPPGNVQFREKSK